MINYVLHVVEYDTEEKEKMNIPVKSAEAISEAC